MAKKTVANLNDSVSGILQGLDLDNVTNLFLAYERTARQLASKISIPTSMGRTNMTLYDGVIDYLAADDLLGTNIVDMQPQGITRGANDYVYKNDISDFDRTKGYLPNGTQITFEARKGTDIMRVVSTRPTPKIELDPFTATTGWTASGSASGLTLDNTVFYQYPGSLRFLLTGASTGILTKTISSNDLTSYIGVGVMFLAIRIPSTETLANLTSITIRLGSSASAYYSVTATTGFLGAFTLGEWLLVPFDLSTATTTGSPTTTAITYAQVRVATAGTITNFYVGDLWISLPTPNTVIYETASIFMVSGSNPSQSIATSADTIILNDAAYAIYEQECAATIAMQQGGNMGSGVLATINETLNGKVARNGRKVADGLYDIYWAENPKQTVKQVGNWYD